MGECEGMGHIFRIRKPEQGVVIPEEEPLDGRREKPDLICLAIDGTSGDRDLEREMALLLARLFELFKAKQSSYGPGNIAAFGERGCLMRANDKIQRLITLVWNGRENRLRDETIDDTWLDLADYALIAFLCRTGKWPGVKRGSD